MVVTSPIAYPAMYHEADATSSWGQRVYIRNARLELALLVAVSIASVVVFKTTAGIDVAGVVAAFLFMAALAVKQHTSSHSLGTRWFHGRAAAESVKTLAWRYAVGGAPFSREMPRGEVDSLFIARLSDIMADLGGVILNSSAAAGPTQITPEMRALRAEGLAVRRETYARSRIEDQRRWYMSKAAHNDQRFRLWMTTTLILEVAGIGAGLVKAFGLLAFTGDLLGVTATLAAAAAAWTQTKQHATLASSYAVAAQELAAVATLVDLQRSEDDWSHFVDSSEAAISREHTLWRASRAR